MKRFAIRGWDRSRLVVERVSESAFVQGEDSFLVSIEAPVKLSVADAGPLMLSVTGSATIDTMLTLAQARTLHAKLGRLLR